MNSPSVNSTSQKKPRAPRRAKRLTQHAQLGELGPETRRTAACVLEVLGGVRSPEQAATTLDLSLPTYYNLEARALRGLIAGCGPVRPGRSMVLSNQLKGAEVRVATLEKEVRRYQALLRATQRSIGLSAAASAPPGTSGGGGGGGGRRRNRRPSVRALRAAAALRGEDAPASPVIADPPSPAAQQTSGEDVVA